MATLKEEYVQKMVALGRQIWALPASDQQSIYDRAMDILSSEGATDWFLSYKDLYERYAALSDQASQDFAVVGRQLQHADAVRVLRRAEGQRPGRGRPPGHRVAPARRRPRSSAGEAPRVRPQPARVVQCGRR